MLFHSLKDNHLRTQVGTRRLVVDETDAVRSRSMNSLQLRLQPSEYVIATISKRNKITLPNSWQLTSWIFSNVKGRPSDQVGASYRYQECDTHVPDSTMIFCYLGGWLLYKAISRLTSSLACVWRCNLWGNPLFDELKEPLSVTWLSCALSNGPLQSLHRLPVTLQSLYPGILFLFKITGHLQTLSRQVLQFFEPCSLLEWAIAMNLQQTRKPSSVIPCIWQFVETSSHKFYNERLHK